MEDIFNRLNKFLKNADKLTRFAKIKIIAHYPTPYKYSNKYSIRGDDN